MPSGVAHPIPVITTRRDPLKVWNILEMRIALCREMSHGPWLGDRSIDLGCLIAVVKRRLYYDT